MTCNWLKCKLNIIVFAVIWIICTVALVSVFSGNPLQGQSVIVFYQYIIAGSVWPALLFFSIYLSILVIVEAVVNKMKSSKTQVETPAEPEVK